MVEMTQATGKCFKCGSFVPSTNLNVFYCGNNCRQQAFNDTCKRKYNQFQNENPDLDEDQLEEIFYNWLNGRIV